MSSWSCSDCTFLNPSGSNCEVCGAHKPVSRTSKIQTEIQSNGQDSFFGSKISKSSVPPSTSVSQSYMSSVRTGGIGTGGSKGKTQGNGNGSSNGSSGSMYNVGTSGNLGVGQIGGSVRPVSNSSQGNGNKAVVLPPVNVVNKKPNEVDITAIVGLGFERQKAVDALIKFDNNREKAIDWCLAQNEKNAFIDLTGSEKQSVKQVKQSEQSSKVQTSEKEAAQPFVSQILGKESTKSAVAGAALPALSAGTALGKAGVALAAKPTILKEVSMSSAMEIEKIKLDAEESRKRKDDIEKEKRLAITHAIVEREEAVKASADLLRKKKADQESKISSIFLA